MNIDVKTTLENACRALLRPVALIVLRCGLTWREFSELSKSVFVAVASEEFGRQGRPTNISRVTLLTGISRKEVKRQRELLEASAPVSSKTTDATRLLSGWHQDPDYRDADGQPLSLPLEGAKPSYETLFATYGGDTPSQTMLRELLTAGSARKTGEDRVVAMRRYHMPADLDFGNLRFFGTNLHDHAATLANNLADDGRPKRLEGFAVDADVDPAHVEEFRAFLDQRGQEILEEIDDWLAKHRINPEDTEAAPVRLGLGVYAIEGPLPKGTLS
ncbi:MAG: DUF6502 family protein [Pseudomonadota bacterium]